MSVHATTVAIAGRAVVIEGASGAGKSDLALRLIDRGALLVADDRTLVSIEHDRLVARCPDRIAGLLEVRGLGLLRLPHLSAAPIALAVLCADRLERMPEPAYRLFDGLPVPRVAVDPRAPSAPIFVELALAQHGLPR
jgi:serine kinase of HPr protein (carbohydrate metabolism regulator)